MAYQKLLFSGLSKSLIFLRSSLYSLISRNFSIHPPKLLGTTNSILKTSRPVSEKSRLNNDDTA